MDGLRAVAILGIILYHMFPMYVPGGFLGVNLFFVLSGYLILLSSAKDASRGEFRTGHFYAKRIRRIYPSLIIAVSMTAIGIWLLAPDARDGLKGEVLSIFGGYNNIWQILQNASYFTKITGQSPLTHMWTIAVELQFYLIWPLLFFGICALWKGGKHAFLLPLSLAALSLIAFYAAYQPGSDPTRVYYGTDTRLFSLLFGSALALLTPPHKSRLRTGGAGNAGRTARTEYAGHADRAAAGSKVLRNICTFEGLLFLSAFLVLYFVCLDQDVRTYRLWIPLSTLLAGGIVLSLQKGGPLGTWLDVLPLRFTGSISYEMYLVMYPIIFFAERTGWAGRNPAGWAAAVIATIYLAAVILHALSGIVTGELEKLVHAARRSKRTTSAEEGALMFKTSEKRSGGKSFRRIMSGAAFCAACFLCVAGTAYAMNSPMNRDNTETRELEARLAENEAMLRELYQSGTNSDAGASAADSKSLAVAGNVMKSGAAAKITEVDASGTAAAESSETSSAAGETNESSAETADAKSNAAQSAPASETAAAETNTAESIASQAASANSASAASQATSDTASSQAAVGEGFTFIGDSVMLDAAPNILKYFPGAVIDAKVSRQEWQGIDVVNALRDQGRLGHTVVIALGANCTFTKKQGEALINAIGADDHLIYWVFPYGQKLKSQEQVVAMITTVCNEYANVIPVNWPEVGVLHPDWFYKDGIHLKPDGNEGYAVFLRERILGS